MANTPILNLPIATALDGSEYAPLVQAGVTKRATIALIAGQASGFVPDTASITAGIGLGGGGTLISSPSLYLDIDTLPANTGMLVADSFAINLASGPTSQKVTFPNAMKAIAGLTNLAFPSLTDDKLAIVRASDGLTYSITPSALGLAAGNVPAGGTTGQVLAKASNTDYDTDWINNSLTLDAYSISANPTGATANSISLTGTAYQIVRIGSTGASLAFGSIDISQSAAVGTSVLKVANGGSGLATTTPYALVAAGTTATGPFQQVSGLGTTNQILASNGAGALPSWKDASTALGAALTKADDTNVTLTLGGTPTTALLAATSITAGWTGQLSLARGGTNASLTASNGGIFYSTATAGAILAGTATANQIVMSGSSSAPAWSTATYPPTTTINQLLYSSSANVIAGLATVNWGLLNAGATGIPALTVTPVLGVAGTSTGTIGFSGATSGVVTVQPQAAAGTYNFNLPTGAGTAGQPLLSGGGGAAAQTYGTLGVAAGGTANTTFTAYAVLCAGTTATGAFQNVSGVGTTNQVLASNGAAALPSWKDATTALGAALTRVDDTNVTLTLGGAPTTALLSATSITAGWTGQLALTRGGTNASLTASNGGMIYSTASAFAVLAGTATAGQIIRSGSSAAPSWSTSVYPATSAAGTILASLTANTITASATPTLGIAGTTLGTLALCGNTSGTVTITPQATAGSPTLTLPNTSGTFGCSATAPITLNTTTGAIGITGAALTRVDDTNVTLTLGGSPSSALVTAASLTLGWTGQLALTRGGTAASLTASDGGIVYSTASAMAILSGTATAGQIIRSGASAAPSWSTSVYPATSAAGTILASLTANTITASSSPVLGAAGTATGQLGLSGTTSGTITVKVADAAGTYNFILPTTVGTPGQVLTTQGGGSTAMTWETVAGTGTVTSVTPGGGLTSTLTATAPGAAITTTGTLSAAMLVNAQTGTTYTVLQGDRAKLVTHTNGSAIAVTLPQAGAASEFQAGWFYDTQNRGVGLVTITPTTSTIDGAASLTLPTGQGCTIFSDGTNYFTQRGRPTGVLVSQGGTGLATFTSNVVYKGNGASALAVSTLTDDGTTVTTTLPGVSPNWAAGYTTTATAAGTTTLTVASTRFQYFTGSTTQTCVLPVTSTLFTGLTYTIVNNSTGVVTVNSSGSNNVLVMGPGSTADFVCILTSGTSAASWSVRSQYANIPQNSQSAAYTTVLSDAGKHILHPTADNNARTFTIDSNANVPYPIGTVITFVNQINTVTLSITSDTLTWYPSGGTGSRTLAANSIATAMKVASTSWVLSGVGVS
jgi:hypothetical protein